jgi:hypothetical protein
MPTVVSRGHLTDSMRLSISHLTELLLRYSQCEPHLVTLGNFVGIPDECVERVQGVREAVDKTGNHKPIVID